MPAASLGGCLVTGGLALGDLDLSQQINSPGSGYHQGGNRTENNVGWFVGGGLEYAITKHWRARAQYQYIDLGSVDFNAHSTDPFHGYTGNSEADLTEHNASFAIIYGF